MKKAAVLLPLLLLIIVVACGGVSATQVERELYSRIDKGDVAGALALIADDAVFEVLGCPQGGCKGKEAIKSAFEGVVAQHPRHTIKSSKDSKNTAASQVEVVVDFARAAGVQRIVANVKVELKGDKISYSQAQFDTSDLQTATAANFLRLSGLLRQHYDAVNKGDVPAAVAVFSEDASVVRGTRCTPANPCVGKGEVRLQRQIEGERNVEARFNIIAIQASGDNLSAQVEVRNVNVKENGLDRVIENVTATFKDSKIARLVQELDLSDSQSAAYANIRRLINLRGQWFAGVNTDNVTGAMRPFAEDAVLQGYGLCTPAPCVGKAAIQKETERQVADRTKTAAFGSRASGDTLIGPVEMRSDSIKAAGVERILAVLTTDVKGDKIVRYVVKLDETDAQTATYLKSQGK